MKQIFIKTSSGVYVNASNVFVFEIKEEWTGLLKCYRLYALSDMEKTGIVVYESSEKDKVEKWLRMIINSMNGGHGVSIVTIDPEGNTKEEEGEEELGNQ